MRTDPATGTKPQTSATEPRERLVRCGKRTYLICRFVDGLVAVYDETGRPVAGWPVTAEWPQLALDGSDDERWCRVLEGLHRALT